MKEKENQLNLTQTEPDPTLSSGRIIMAEDGEGLKPEINREEILREHRDKIRAEWNEQFPLPENTPNAIRGIINAFIDSGRRPDHLSAEQLENLRGFLPKNSDDIEQDIDTSAAGGGDGGDGNGEGPRNSNDSEEPQDENENNYETLTLPSLLDIVKDRFIELSRSEKREYSERLAEISRLPKDEQKSAVIEFVTEIDDLFQNEDRLISLKMKRLIEDANERENQQGITREEVLEDIKQGLEVERETQFANLVDLIENYGLSEEASNTVIEQLLDDRGFLGMVAANSRGDQAEINRVREYIQGIKNNNDLTDDVKKARFREIADSVTKIFYERQIPRNPDQYNPVNSVQELARYIISSQNAEYWGPEGIYPLIDKEGKFHPENLLKWAREQSVLLHVSNPNDQISPLGSIHVSTGFRDVSLIEMTLVNKQRYFRDEDTGEIMEDLANEMLNQTWLFGVVRNSDLVYRQTMNEDKKLPEVIAQIHSKSDITRSTNLRDILTMSGEFGSGEISEGRVVLFANDFYYNISDWEKLTEIVRGQEIQRGLASLEKDLQDGVINEEVFATRVRSLFKRESGQIFTREDFRDAIRVFQGKKDWEDIDSLDGYYDANNPDEFYCTDLKGNTHRLFDEDGNFNVLAFVNVMNFYNYANAPQTMFGLVKELVRLKAAEKYGLNPGIARTEEGKASKKEEWEEIIRRQMALGRSREQAESAANRRLISVERYAERVNLTFAENMGEHFQRAYGGGARNDTNRRGYDASTKGYLDDYIIRQSEAVRAGPTGVRESIGIYRNVIPDMWTALKTETGYSPMEIFTSIRGIENIPQEDLVERYLSSGRIEREAYNALSEVEKKDVIDKAREDEIREWVGKLKFNQGAERDIAGNVKMRGFQMFHAQTGGERLDINKMVTYDPIQGILIDLAYVEEHFNDGFIKPARYFGNTNGGMKFSSTVRRLDVSKTGEDGYPVYEDVTLAEASYGPEVIALVKKKWAKEHGNEEMDFRNLTAAQKNYLDSAGKMDMVKFGLALHIAAEMRHHRHFGGPGSKWGYVRTEAFLSLLKHMEELEPDPDNPGRTRVKLGSDGKPKRFFDENLMELIKEKGDYHSKRVLAEDLGIEMGGPALSSIIEIIARTAAFTVKA